MLIASASDDGAPRLRAPAPAPLTPHERALVARELAAECLPDPLPCRHCALEVFEEIVRLTIEEAERDLRLRLLEDDSCRN